MTPASLAASLALLLLLAPGASAGVDPVDTALDLTEFPSPPPVLPPTIDGRSMPVFNLHEIPVVPRTQAPAEDTPPVPTPDLQPVPSVPVAHLDQVGFLHLADRGGDYCIEVSAGGLDHQTLVCVNRDDLHEDDLGVQAPRGDIPLGEERQVDTPPLPGAAVPDVPSVPEGFLVSTAQYKMGLLGTLRWDCGRIETFVSALDAVQTYRPFPQEPETAAWAASGGGDTVGLEVKVTLSQDNEVRRVYTVVVPFVGQALAAAGMSADPDAWC